MSVTEAQDTALTTVTGTWSTETDTNHSGGTAKKSSAGGSTLSYTGTFRELWELTATSKTGCVFDVAVDGGPATRHHLNNTLWAGDAPLAYRTLYPLARGLADGTHTVVITVVSGTVYVDSLLPVTGARLKATKGVLSCVGDSWMNGTGASAANLAMAPVIQQGLQQALHRPITLTDINTTSVGSDRLWAVYVADGTGQRPGGMYRAVQICTSGVIPEFWPYLYGYNDITSGTARPFDMYRHSHATLAFIGDVCDVAGPYATVHVGWGTPGFPSTGVLNFVSPGLNSGSGAQGLMVDVYEGCVREVRRAVKQFPWAIKVDVWKAMNYRQSLVLPNSSGDYGIHPNTAGHSVIAGAYIDGFTGVQV